MAKMVGEWVFGLSVLVTVTLGIYSFILLYRGRVILALLGFILCVAGALLLPAI